MYEDLSTGTTLATLTGSRLIANLEAIQLAKVHRLQESVSVLINLNATQAEGRFSGDVVVLALALLFLQLERNSADGSLLDAAHEMGGETGNLVAEALAAADGHIGEEALVGLEVESEARVILLNEEARSLLDGLGTNATLFPTVISIKLGDGSKVRMDGTHPWGYIIGNETYHLVSRRPRSGVPRLIIEMVDVKCWDLP